MIRKIRRNEILPRYDAMAAKEKKAYLKRVGGWLKNDGRRLLAVTDRPMARAQNIIQLSSRWTQEDCDAFQQGAILLSAHMELSDTWLPAQLYVKAASRAVQKLVDELTMIQSKAQNNETAQAPTKRSATKTKAGVTRNNDMPKYRHNENETAQAPTKTKTLEPTPKVHLNRRVSATGTLAPVRPRHIDQYVHLLPQATQVKASHYRELRRQIDEAREKLRLLMNDPHASAASREQWAKLVTKLDNQVGSINRELDREWAKIVAEGKVIVDDFGIAHVVSNENETPTATKTKTKRAPKKKATKAKQDPAKRKEYLKKWLRDIRYGTKETKGKEWKEKVEEFIKLGGELTPSIRKAAEHYGVELSEG